MTCLVSAAVCNGCISRWVAHIHPDTAYAGSSPPAEALHPDVFRRPNPKTCAEVDQGRRVRGRSQTGATLCQAVPAARLDDVHASRSTLERDSTHSGTPTEDKPHAFARWGPLLMQMFYCHVASGPRRYA